jgi:hypothetical protein
MKGYLYLIQDWWHALTHKEQKGSSIGVWIFKLSKDHPFNPAARAHDEAYKKHDLSTSTDTIDAQFLYWAFVDIEQKVQENEQERYNLETWAAYRLARIWGAARYGLARVGIVW